MADIEKVKQAVAICCGVGHCKDCGYTNKGHYTDMNCRLNMMHDVLSVIEQMEQRIKQFMQEQEPLEPVVFGNGKTFEEAETWWYGCPVCKKPVDTTDNFCRKCGRAITWQKDGDVE